MKPKPAFKTRPEMRQVLTNPNGEFPGTNTLTNQELREKELRMREAGEDFIPWALPEEYIPNEPMPGQKFPVVN